MLLEELDGFIAGLLVSPELISPSEGFEKAVALRPAAWKKLLDADADTATAMSGMLLLADIAGGDQEMKESDTLSATASDKIADWVVALNEWRLASPADVGHRSQGRLSLDEKGRS